MSAGVTNMVLDYLFIAVLGFGLAGAAIATVCGELIGGLFPYILFFKGKLKSALNLVEPNLMVQFFLRLAPTVLPNL